MSEVDKNGPAIEGHTCPRCANTVTEDDRFCRNCGTELHTDVEVIQAIIGRVLPERIDAVLKERFREQKVVEIETAELLADRAVKWLKTFGFLLGIPVLLVAAAFSFVGIKTWSDLQHITEQATALEKQLTGPQQQLARTTQQISELSKELEAAKQSLSGQISQVGQRQTSLEEQLRTIRNRLGFCPEGELSAELKKKLEDDLTSFIAWLEGIGFDKLTDHVSVCIYSERTKLPLNLQSNQINAFYAGSNNSLYIHTSMAAEQTVPLREYSHHALLKGSNEGARNLNVLIAVESALADYLPASFLGTPIVGADLGKLFNLKTSYIRNLENDLRSNNDNDYRQGEVWAGALWACRKINRKLVDEVVLVAWRAAYAGPEESASSRFGAALEAAPAPMGACLADQIAKRALPPSVTKPIPPRAPPQAIPDNACKLFPNLC